MPVPQAIPFGWFPLSVQTGAPVVQATIPIRQGCPEREQAVPAVHETQAPLLHTRLVPQAVPLACGCCVSAHDAPLLLQLVCPT